MRRKDTAYSAGIVEPASPWPLPELLPWRSPNTSQCLVWWLGSWYPFERRPPRWWTSRSGGESTLQEEDKGNTVGRRMGVTLNLCSLICKMPTYLSIASPSTKEVMQEEPGWMILNPYWCKQEKSPYSCSADCWLQALLVFMAPEHEVDKGGNVTLFDAFTSSTVISSPSTLSYLPYPFWCSMRI